MSEAASGRAADEVELAGAVDQVGLRRIFGWVKLAGAAPRRLVVSVAANGRVLRREAADLYREDVRQAGFGDGCHGFDFALADGEIAPGSVVTVAVEPAHGLARQVVFEQALFDLERLGLDLAAAFGAEPPPAPNAAASLHIDVTDLLVYFDHHRRVSGIQRVQCGYIANLLAMPKVMARAGFCLQASDGSGYRAVAAAEMTPLLAAVQGKAGADGAAWQAALQRLLDPRRRAAPCFAPGHVLLVLGAPWVRGDYFAAVAAARREHGVRYVQLFYDLIPTLLPETCDSGLVHGFNRALAGMLRHADHVLAISRHSLADLRRLAAACEVAMPPASLVPLGAAPEYGPARKARPADAAFLARHGLEEYVLCVGTLEPRKNHLYLYRIWKRLAAELGAATPRLVFAGRLGWHIEELQRTLRASGNLDGRILHLPEPSDGELATLYRGCLFTVFPSLYEGWGLPVAESLRYGKPVVTSSVSAMPEAGGDLALYVDPLNVESGYACIHALLTDRAALRARAGMVRAGYRPTGWPMATRSLVRRLAAVERGGAAAALPELPAGRAWQFAALSARAPQGTPERVIRHELERLALAELLDGPGWVGVESWGARARGQALLAFRSPPIPGLLAYLALRGADPGEEVTLTVRLGAEDVATIAVAPGQTRLLRLALPAGADIRLALVAGAPGQGIGLAGLFLCAEQDAAARLTYLESQLAG
ncbi:MAG: glycosyltransferase family 4 protein [Rhodospirillales bacterium]|nr:glycosyltransferase family 4 protein [Rhodospirillales bacterium]